MHLFFLAYTRKLVIFYMSDQKFGANLDPIFLVFSCSIVKVNQFCIVFLYLYI